MYIHRPFHNFHALVALSLSAVGAIPALAQDDVPAIPLDVRDIVPATGFSPDAVTDVMGLNVGMTQAESEAAFMNMGLPLMENAEEVADSKPFGPRRVGYRFRSGEIAPMFSWDDGFQMAFQPVRASAGLTMYSEQADALGALAEYINGQYLWVSFGGPSVGNRVQEVRRSQMLDDPVDAQVMLDSITEKYGPPSRIKEQGRSWIDIAYYFKNGELVADNDSRRLLFSLNCKPLGVTRGSSDILYSDVNANSWFGNGRDSRPTKELCDANVFVQLHFGDLPNTIDRIDVQVIDNVARFENAQAIAMQAEAVHAEWLESVAGSSTAPDL